MSPDLEQLLQRLFSSRQFVYADSLRRIVAYLCEHAAGADKPTIKEFEIATEALGRPVSFDPKTDPVVRVSIASVRERLRAYFDHDGGGEPFILSIPKGRYHAILSERTQQAPPGTAAAPGRFGHPALGRFWQPYAAPSAHNVVMYTEPLFFRDDKTGQYLRSLYLNDRSASGEDIRKRLPVTKATQVRLRPSYHYLSAGEMQCSFSLIRMFGEMGATLEMRNARLSLLNDFHRANLILLGSTRTNHFLGTMQEQKGFALGKDAILNPHPRPGEQTKYAGKRYLDGKLARFLEHALVTRRPGLSPGTALTTIASNHGRAIQGGGNVLTLESQAAALLKFMGLSEGEPVPPSFQVLLRVEMIDLDDEVVNVIPIAYRISH